MVGGIASGWDIKGVMRPSLKKRYGQHHLRDGGLCRPLLEDLRPDGERVLEIGPGGGILTRELLAAGGRVLACEVDAEWAFHLLRTFREETAREETARDGAPRGDLRIVAIDALEIPWHRLPSPTLVTGNLPFNVATPILEALLQHPETIPRASFMVQKEVGERLTAEPGSKAYGALTVMTRAWAATRYLGTVAPGSFHPPPKVAAAFVGFRLHAPPLPRERMGDFRAFVYAAFAHRRKTLRNNLKSAYGSAAAARAFEISGIDPGRRAEELALDEHLELFKALDPQPASP